MMTTKTWAILAGLAALSSAQSISFPSSGRFSISGSVVEERIVRSGSTPVAGIKVYLRGSSDLVLLGASVSDGAAGTGGAGIARPADSAITDRTGAFLFSDREAGSYRLSFVGQGWHRHELGLALAQDTSMRVALVPVGTTAVLRGVVEADACPEGGVTADSKPCSLRPMPGCTVTVAFGDQVLSLGRFLPGGAAGHSSALTAVTDQNGEYTIRVPLASDREPIVVSARGNGFRTVQRDTAVSGNETVDIDFALSPNRPLAVGSGAGFAKGHSSGVLSYSGKDRLLTIRIPRGQNVSIEAYLTNGKKEQRLSTRRYFAAGVYTFSLDGGRYGTGIAVITVRGEGFSETKRIPIAGG